MPLNFQELMQKTRQSSTRRILHAENQFILATFAYQTRPDHMTPHQTIQLGYTKIPLFRVDYCTVYLHDQPSLNTLTILSTPTKLTNLSTLTTDQKGYPEDKCNACWWYIWHICLYTLGKYECHTCTQTDGRTDGWTDSGRQCSIELGRNTQLIFLCNSTNSGSSCCRFFIN